jgi:hypothetical protein
MCQLRLLKLLLIMATKDTNAGRTAASNTYVQAILMDMLLNMHRFQEKLPAWTLLKEHLCMFNEEPGEMSFSVLSRTMLADSTQNHLAHVNKTFQTIHLHKAMDDSFRSDSTKSFKTFAKSRKVWSKASPEVVATSSFLSMRVREMKHTQGKYMVYPYMSIHVARKHQAHDLMEEFSRVTPFWQVTIKREFDFQLEKCQKFTSTWASELAHADWPEFLPVNDPVADMEVPMPPPIRNKSVMSDAEEQEQEEDELGLDNVQVNGKKIVANEDEESAEEEEEDTDEEEEEEKKEEEEENVNHSRLIQGSKRHADAVYGGTEHDYRNTGTWKDWGKGHNQSDVLENKRSRRRTVSRGLDGFMIRDDD